MSTKADRGFIDDRAVWIHSYRFSHSRRLSDQELLGIQKEARRQRALAVQAGVGSFLMAMLAIGSLVSISLMPVVFWSFFALSYCRFPLVAEPGWKS